MTFVAPTLGTYTGDDLNYVNTWNSNVQLISNAFSQIENALATAFNGSALQYGADWGRTIAVADPNGGALGPYSFVFNDIGSGQFRLDADNHDSVSSCIMGTTRRQTTSDLTGDWSDLALADGDHTVYVGVDASGDTGVSLGFSTTKSSVTLPLWVVDLTVASSGTVFTVNTVVREPRSLLWDNTLEQLRQEVPKVIRFTSAILDAAPIRIQFHIPERHRLRRLFFLGNNSESVNLQLSNVAETIDYITLNGSMTADTLNTQAVSATYEDYIFAADTVYILYLALGSFSAAEEVTLGVEYFPEYNVPTT